MKLLIVSHTAHYIKSGTIVGWEPTIQEINHLAQLFDEIRHVAWLHTEPPPAAVMPYATSRISFIPVPPSGGRTLLKKFSILTSAPRYLQTIRKHLKWADLVHVRCPSNIGLITIIVLALTKNPPLRWVKYATNWRPTGKEPISFRFQRWWLRKGLHRGIVTVNGRWPEQAEHIHSFLNPCIVEDEIALMKNLSSDKNLSPPFHFLFVGRLVESKGCSRALRILAELHRKHIPFRFDIVGDGDREELERNANVLGLQDSVQFHGWLPRSELNSFYQSAHFLLFPSSSSEGWPKVLSEAMGYGTVPIAGAISSIPQILREFRTGVSLPADKEELFVDAILEYIRNPAKWASESRNATSAVHHFTYETYLRDLRKLLEQTWDRSEKAELV